MNKIAKNGLIFIAFIAPLVFVHYQLRSGSLIYNFLFPPNDLYSNLAESDFDLSVKGLERELRFIPKYPGNHWLAILVESPPEIMEKYKSDFKVKIQVISEKGVISESVASNSSFWFRGGKGRNGFALVTYKAPSDLPLKRPLTLKASVMKESPDFEKQYGTQRIIVRKYSDK